MNGTGRSRSAFSSTDGNPYCTAIRRRTDARTAASWVPASRVDAIYGTESTAGDRRRRKESIMLGTILLILLVMLLVGALPRWPHSRGWGYGPSGGLGLVLLIVLILVLMGRI